MTGFLLQDLTRNTPGLGYINFVEQQGVASIPSSSAGVVSENIILKSGYDFFRGEFLFDSAEMEVVQGNDASGDFYTTVIPGFLPIIRPDVTYNFSLMHDNQYLVVAKDENLYKHIIGNVHTGAKFTWKYGTKVLGGSKVPGYDFTFTFKSKKPPLVYLPEEEDAYLIPEAVDYVATGYHTTFLYYNTSDPAIAAVPPDNKKRKFSVLAGKSLDDFHIVLNNQPLIQQDPDAADNQITGITGDGTVTFKNNVPANGQFLVFVKL